MPAIRSVRSSLLRVVAVAVFATGALGVAYWVHRTPTTTEPATAHPPADAVARVGTTFLTAAELRSALQRRHRVDASDTARDAALEERIRRALLFAEAERSGFTAQPELQEAWRSLVVQRFADSLEERRTTLGTVSEADIVGHYATHPEAYATAERRHLALIQVSLPPGASAERRAALADEVAALHAQVQTGNGRGFAELASRHSTHAGSRHAGGDLGWLQRAQALRAWPAAVVDAAFALAADGDISAPIATEEGWFILRRLEVQSSQPQPLDKVRERIRQEVTRARLAEAEAMQWAELRARHAVEIYPDRVAAVEVPVSKSTKSLAQQPPSLPAR